MMSEHGLGNFQSMVLEFREQFDPVAFYLRVKDHVLAEGYAEEIEWQRAVIFENATPEKFFLEYVWVVISSGMKNQVARKINDRFQQNFPNFDAIGHKGKREAIQKMWAEFPRHFSRLKELSNDRARINYLGSIPFLGPITKWHLAKNLGMDVAKPDRHLVRVAARYGFDDVQDFCKWISVKVGDRISVVDLIIWRYCNLKGSN